MTQLLFSFHGRLNRKPYWTIVIATAVVFILLLLLALAMIREYGLEFLLVSIAILVILYVPLIWIGLALGAKRLHDRDKSAWWLLVFYALPTILSTAADQWRMCNSSSCISSVSPLPFGPSSSWVACAGRWDPIAMAPIR